MSSGDYSSLIFGKTGSGEKRNTDLTGIKYQG